MESDDDSLLYTYDREAVREMKEMLTDFVDTLQYDYYEE